MLNCYCRFTLWHGQDVDHPQFGYASWAYEGVGAFHRLYGQSKLAQIYHARYVEFFCWLVVMVVMEVNISLLCCRELSRQAAEKGDNVIGMSVHPGAVR